MVNSGLWLGVDALVAEDPAHLVDTLQPADHQPLERELEGDAEIHVGVEGVVMGDEGASQPTPACSCSVAVSTSRNPRSSKALRRARNTATRRCATSSPPRSR